MTRYSQASTLMGMKMLDFSDFPKQWVIGFEDLPISIAGKVDKFAGLYIAAAEDVPILQMLNSQGIEVGRLIGWVIEGTKLHHADGVIRLASGETPEMIFVRLAGRFVMLWQSDDGKLLLREDSAGGLPAIYVPKAGLVGATVTLLDTLYPLSVNLDIEAIFDFPKHHGFLPFGLTPRYGARRVMPNHVLDLGNFGVRRVWPVTELCFRKELSEVEIANLVLEAASILRHNVAAILSQGETVLYLSGGYDSRMILAAARGRTDMLRAETLGDARSLDAHVAAHVARYAGIKHSIVSLQTVNATDVKAWLHRSGRMMCDTVSSMGPTIAATSMGTHSLSGTGADIVKGTTFNSSDTKSSGLTVERILTELNLPDHPEIRCAGQAWIDGLMEDCPLGTAMMLDLVRMEQRHGGWGGAAIYGHPVIRPSLQPFSGQRLYEITLAMPTEYRLKKKFYFDLMRELWPELLEVPINRADGAARFLFWKNEVRNALPGSIKRYLKRILQSFRNQ